MSTKQPITKQRDVFVDQMKRIQKNQEYEAPQYTSEIQPLQPQVIAPQNKEANYLKGQRVLDRMARVTVDQEADEPSIFSYHYEYKDYLDYYRFIDPERAKRKEEVERRKLAKQLDAHLDKNIPDGDESGGEEGEGAIGDSAVSGFDDGESGGQPLPVSGGGGRFDNLIKSLIARIEFNNTLAPIQDYGRHQKKAAQFNKNKKNKKKTLGKNEQSETPSDAGGAKQDENFYDLDDDFIDDEDIMMIDQDDDMMHDFYDHSKNQSAAQSELPDLLENEDGGKSEGDDTNQMDDQSFDSDKERQQKRYQKILRNFKVLMPDEVEEMLAEDFKKEELRKNERLKRDQPQQPTIASMLQNGGTQTSAFTPNPLQKTSSSSNKPKDQYPLQSPMIGQAPVPDRTPTTAVSVKNGKKRDRDEFNASNQVRGDEHGEIEQIISSLRERVLMNETLNNFKKEISQIADLVERRDPSWSQQFSSSVAQKLSQVLQKQQPQEILYMLQRTSLMEKRKKKKAEFDKNLTITKQCIERDLKQQNKKSEEDYIDLPLINPAKAKFSIANDS